MEKIATDIYTFAELRNEGFTYVDKAAQKQRMQTDLCSDDRPLGEYEALFCTIYGLCWIGKYGIILFLRRSVWYKDEEVDDADGCVCSRDAIDGRYRRR